MVSTAQLEKAVNFGSPFHSGDKKLRFHQPQARTNLHAVHACLVESNDTVRFLIHHYAQNWGMACTVADNGADALELLRTAAGSDTPCDLVIIDQQLSDMSGVDLAQMIKADPVLSNSRLIMLSSLAKRGEARMAKNAGFSAYLTKPVRQEQLYKCLTMMMGTSPDEIQENATRSQTLITRHTLEEAEKRTRVRILLAEDNIVNQKVAVKMLQKLGYQVDVVDNGREATEAIVRTAYDAILMDCQMPEMDGWEATKEIRLRETENGKGETEEGSSSPVSRLSSSIPIIAMTANAMTSDRERCLESGMDDFIPKPVKLEELAKILQRWTSYDTPQEEHMTTSNQHSASATPETPQATPPLDKQVLDELGALGGEDDPEFLASVIDQFLQDIPRHLAGIRQAMEQQNADGLMKAAHGFQRQLPKYRRQTLSRDLLGSWKRLGREGSTQGADEKLTQLNEEIERVTSALHSHVHHFTSS